MALHKQGEDITAIHKRHKHKWRSIVAVHKGLRLVWEAVRSCYGKGYWIQEKPWVNDDIWKDHK